MFPPSPHLSNSPANTQAVFPSAVAEWGVGGGGRRETETVLTCTMEGQRSGGSPLAGPVSPPPGQASCPLETNRPLKTHKGCKCLKAQRCLG